MSSIGVLIFAKSGQSRRGIRTRRPCRREKDCSDRSSVSREASTAASNPVEMQNGNPTSLSASANAAGCCTASTRSTTVGFKKGISQLRNRTRSACARRRAVSIPPIGPLSARRSTRTTRHANPKSAAKARAWPSIVRRPTRRRALSSPIRRLWPPARTTASMVFFLLIFLKNGLPFAWCMILCRPFPTVRQGKAMARSIRARVNTVAPKTTNTIPSSCGMARKGLEQGNTT